MQACRKDLLAAGRGQAAHAGLLLTRYLAGQDDPEQRSDLWDAAVRAAHSGLSFYRLAFDRYSHSLDAREPKKVGRFSVNGRLIVGLGADNVLETGITLHHTYGVPVIPGSALKGLAAHYCDQVMGRSGPEWRKPHGECHRAMFGGTDDSGHLVFHDAWVVPESLSPGSREGLVQDVMTPHHGEYYDGKQPAPTDFDDPNPVGFLSVAGTFLVAVSCDEGGPNGSRWTDLGFAILEQALGEWGVGGKTSSGYGRMKPAVPASRAGQESAPSVRTTAYPVNALVTATRVRDPKAKEGESGRAWFVADDGRGGVVVGEQPPEVKIGEKIQLQVQSASKTSYNFRLPRPRK
jgi:CRISPR-associated protein Cmr6